MLNHALRLGKFALVIVVCLYGLHLLVRRIQNDWDWRLSNNYLIDLEYGYLPKPLAHSDWVDEHGAHEISHINSLGFRGPELDSVKKKKRIFLVGSSLVYGYGVGDDSTISAQLQSILDNHDVPAEVINAGINSFTLDQIFKFINHKILPLHPDRVIWLLNESNLDWMGDTSLNLYDLDPKSESLVERDIRKSPFYSLSDWAEEDPRSIKGQVLLNLYVLIADAAMWWDQFKTGKSGQMAKFEAMTRSLQRTSVKLRVAFDLVLLPDRTLPNDPLFPKEKFALPFFNLSREEVFWRNPDENFLNDQYHFSRKGNLEIATLIYSRIF